MTRSLVRSPQAEQDLGEIADYLAQKSPRAAVRFLDAAEVAFKRLTEVPELGGLYESANPRLAGLRVWPISGFAAYLIFYRSTEQGVEIVRVIHGARDLENQ